MSYTYNEIKTKTLSLIEELNPNNPNLTDDPDIATKFLDVTNQVLFELARTKKLCKNVEMDVTEGERIEFSDLSMACGYEVYQIGTISGVNFSIRANGTVLKALESGTADIDCFIYPDRITDANAEKYRFELSQDALEIMPYGIAADLLKSDVSTDYGSVYATRYESMLQRLDPRYSMTNIYIEGGVNV